MGGTGATACARAGDWRPADPLSELARAKLMPVEDWRQARAADQAWRHGAAALRLQAAVSDMLQAEASDV
eukprot:365739-Chlamydomonas_euryale.AAC.5